MDVSIEETRGFDELNSKVMTLVSRYKDLKSRNEELERTVTEQKNDIEILESKVANLNLEREDVKTNIDKIISKIEELEVGE